VGSILKRTFDIVVAGAALVATTPLLVVVASAIRLDSKGSVLFAQTRVGRKRAPIRTLKFRSMVTDAERRGPQITTSGDPRITRVGKFLRRTKLDEIPQLWNVVRGDMSIVGPRPEVPAYVALYPAEWSDVFNVRPGLTDHASLVFRHEEELLARASDRDRAYREVVMPMKLALALDGVRKASLRYDIEIVVRTALAILGRSSESDRAILAEARRRIDDLNAKENAV
jgi:lipopolysaccharide/colanic/teichoic acid biosynthesis glycosyltransferase